MKTFFSLFLILASICSQPLWAAPQCRLAHSHSLVPKAELQLTQFFDSGKTRFGRDQYLQAMALEVSKHQAPDVYKEGGRLQIELDENGKEIEFKYGRKAFLHPNFLRVRDFLKSYPENFMELLNDPAIVSHCEDFISFLMKCSDCRKHSPLEVREQLRAALGKKTVYRGVYLSETQAQRILSDGFFARNFETNEGMTSPRLESLLKTFSTQIQRHVSGDPFHAKQSNFLSVSEFPAVSIAVADKFKQTVEQGMAIYLFRLEIPVLDLVDPFSYHLNGPPDERVFINQTGHDTLAFEFDHRVESLVPFRILPTEIKEVQRIEKPEFELLQE